MTGRHVQSELAGLPLSRGALLRAAADGELSDAQRAELDRTLSGAESRAIETEAALRQAVGRVLSQPAAPASLRQRILAAAAAAGEMAGEAEDPDEKPAPIPMAPWMRPLAVAAAVLLVIAGGFMFMRGEGGEGAGIGATGESAGVQAAGIQLVELRRFVSREHDRCERDPDRAGKFIKTEITEVPERYRSLMGAEVSIEEILKADLTLRGVGECRVPGPGRSIHLLLGADLPESSGTLSLFVQQDAENRLGLDEGASYELAPREAAGEAARAVSIIAWRRDGLTYYLVTDADACARIREAMGRGGQCAKL